MIRSLLCRWNLHHAWRVSIATNGRSCLECRDCGRRVRHADAGPPEDAARLRDRVTARVWSEVGPQP